MIQTDSIRRLFAYRSAAITLGPKLSILTSPRLEESESLVRTFASGLEQPQSMASVE